MVRGDAKWASWGKLGRGRRSSLKKSDSDSDKMLKQQMEVVLRREGLQRHVDKLWVLGFRKPHQLAELQWEDVEEANRGLGNYNDRINKVETRLLQKIGHQVQLVDFAAPPPTPGYEMGRGWNAVPIAVPLDANAAAEAAPPPTPGYETARGWNDMGEIEMRPTYSRAPSSSARRQPWRALNRVPTHSTIADFVADDLSWQIDGDKVVLVADHGDGWSEVDVLSSADGEPKRAKGCCPSSFLQAEP